jgi:hypothetical protein
MDTADAGAAGAAGNRKAQKRAEAEARQRGYAQKKPLADKLAKLEREMAALDTERKSIETWLASPEAYDEAGKETLKSHVARQGDLGWQLARLEAEWLEISDALDNWGLRRSEGSPSPQARAVRGTLSPKVAARGLRNPARAQGRPRSTNMKRSHVSRRMSSCQLSFGCRQRNTTLPFARRRLKKSSMNPM